MQNTCFEASSSQSDNTQREKLWGSFHRLRSCPSYKTFWSRFLQSRDCEADPIFYQYVSDSVFKELVKKHYPLLDQGAGREQPQQSLSYEEKNALQYTATSSTATPWLSVIAASFSLKCSTCRWFRLARLWRFRNLSSFSALVREAYVAWLLGSRRAGLGIESRKC